MPPTTTTFTTDVAVVDPQFSDAEQYALAAFLADCRGLTRDAYALELRQFIAWCGDHGLRLFAVRRADIECFARDLEERGRARATVVCRLCTVAGFYRYAEQEGLLERSPAAHVRRPRPDYESHTTCLDRNEVGALLAAAALASAREHALVSLLAINGLRVSEALGADIEALGIERGHRTLTIVRKGGKSSPSHWRREQHERSTWPSGSASKDRSSSEATANASTGRLADRATTPVGLPADAMDVEPGDVLEDPVARHELQAQRDRGGRDPPIRLVDLLRQRIAGKAQVRAQRGTTIDQHLAGLDYIHVSKRSLELSTAQFAPVGSERPYRSSVTVTNDTTLERSPMTRRAS